MKKLIIILSFLNISIFSYSQERPILKIGLIADPQYKSKGKLNGRYYKDSYRKIKEAINILNKEEVDFVQNMGDMIDQGIGNYDIINKLYEGLNNDIEVHNLLGNHDFLVSPDYFKELKDLMSMPDFYYSYSIKNWRFIVLDATDYAFYSYSVHNYKFSDVDSFYIATEGKNNHYLWNSAIGNKQKTWLRTELDSALSKKQKVIIFSHLPLRPIKEEHSLWNAEEIIEIIEGYPNVTAFISGHNHEGNYVLKNGINYITLFGMINTDFNSFGILEIYDDKMMLRGFGFQQTYLILFEKEYLQNIYK